MLRVLLLQHQCPTNALRCSESPRRKRSSFSSYFFLYQSRRCPPFPETLPKQPSPITHILQQQSLGSRIASKSIDQQKSNYHFLTDLQDLPPHIVHFNEIPSLTQLQHSPTSLIPKLPLLLRPHGNAQQPTSPTQPTMSIDAGTSPFHYDHPIISRYTPPTVLYPRTRCKKKISRLQLITDAIAHTALSISARCESSPRTLPSPAQRLGSRAVTPHHGH